MQEFCGICLGVVYRWQELYGGNFLEAITQAGIFPEVLWFGVIEPFSIFALQYFHRKLIHLSRSMLIQLLKKCKYDKRLYEILVVIKLCVKQNHGAMIRQVRKSWQTTSAFLSLKVYAFLKFTLDRFYNSYKEPTLSSWKVCQFPGFFAVLKATGDSFSFISEGTSYNIFGSV